MSPSIYVSVFLIGAGLAALLTPLGIYLGKRWGIADAPGGRRRHKGIVSRLGGLGLYPAFAIAALVPLAMPIPRTDPLETTRLIGVVLGTGVIWVMGLLDDRFKLPGWAQLVGILLGAGVAIAFKVFIEVFNSPFSDRQIWVDWYLMVPITIIWITSLTGTMNLVDGLDGLATGITAIAALVLFIHMMRLGQQGPALLPLALLGCCLGFLPYNVSPARIFLGGGAYVLGYIVSTASIVAGAKVATALLVLWFPIVDVIWQGYSRWRRGQPVSLGDRGHLHLRLQDMGWPTWRIVLMYDAITAALGAIALFCPSRLLKLGVLVGVALIALPLLAAVTRRAGDATPTGH